MATIDSLSAPSDLVESGDLDYRALNTGAVASVVFGLLSAGVFLAGGSSLESAVLMTPIPLIGLALGWRALGAIRANPDQFTGRKAALAGVALSAVGLVGGLAYAGYVHATEVPAGYVRTSFADLKPDEVDLRGDHFVPPEVMALNGKKVFIKGYIRPDSTKYRTNIQRFLLVRDNNQCCFGDLSTVKYFDQVDVTMVGPETVDYTPSLFRMGGKLHVKPQNAANGSGAPVFSLEADHAE